jgi:hypothetical protein
MCLMKYQWYWNDEINNEIEVEQIAAADMDGSTIWYPQKAHKTMFDDKTGTRKYELTVKDFVPNVGVDEDTFRFDFPPGTDVHDRVLGLSYVVGSAGPEGEVSRVSIVEPVEQEQQGKQASGHALDPAKSTPEMESKKTNQTTNKNMERKESPIPVKPVSTKKRILGLKTLSTLGVVILALAALTVWRKRSANI